MGGCLSPFGGSTKGYTSVWYLCMQTFDYKPIHSLPEFRIIIITRDNESAFRKAATARDEIQ